MPRRTKQEKTLTPKLRFPKFKNGPGWKVHPLGLQVDFYKGRGISKTEIDASGQRSCIRYGELYTRYGEVIKHVYSRTNVPDDGLFLSREGDVIIPASGETKEDIATASCVMLDDVALGSDLNVIRTKHDGQFLSYFLNGKKRLEIAKIAQGDAVVHLYPSQLENVPIAFPDVAEQRKVAACLASLDHLLAAEGRKLEALRAYKKGLMQQLFPGEGESQPRLRLPEFRNAGEWKTRTMEDISTIVRGGSPRPIDAFLTNDPAGLNWLKIGDVDEGAKYVTRTEQRVRLEALPKTRVIKPGDFILSNSMSFGRPYISQIDTCIHDGWIAVTEIEAAVDHEFLYYSILCDRSQAYFEDQAAGGGVRNLTTNIVKALPLRFGDRREQRRIAACLSSLDALIAAVSRKLDGHRAHKKGLMQQLFPSQEEV